MLNFLIDSRELKAKQYFESKSNVEVRNLDLGDFIFKYNDEIVCLIERKTLTDLLASLKDGRYREQKMRLKNCGIETNKIIYLIEAPKLTIWDLSDKIALSCIIGTMIRDDLKVFRTVNIEETLHFLERIYTRLLENPSKIFVASNNKTVQLDYANILKVKKKENLTPQVCNILQLSQIPGLSQSMAKTILDKYKSIFGLCQAYQELETETDKQLMVATMKYDLNNEKQRNIGKVVSNRLYQYITGTNE